MAVSETVSLAEVVVDVEKAKKYVFYDALIFREHKHLVATVNLKAEILTADLHELNVHAVV